MQNAMISSADRQNVSYALDSVARDKSFPVIEERDTARREIYIPVPRTKEPLSRRICRLDGKMVDAVRRTNVVGYFPVNVRGPAISAADGIKVEAREYWSTALLRVHSISRLPLPRKFQIAERRFPS